MSPNPGHDQEAPIPGPRFKLAFLFLAAFVLVVPPTTEAQLFDRLKDAATDATEGSGSTDRIVDLGTSSKWGL